MDREAKVRIFQAAKTELQRHVWDTYRRVRWPIRFSRPAS